MIDGTNNLLQSLREKLISNGAGVNMIGSVDHGTMEDNQNEGWPGYRVDQINVKADKDLSSLPNLVLVNAGTNDVAQNYYLDTVDDRLEGMVDKLLDNIPGTVVIVSTLLYNLNSTKQERTEKVNKKFISMVESMADSGKRVYLSDMSAITAGDINATDGTHPTDGRS
jgi:lysophospholipase L1-like esterase